MKDYIEILAMIACIILALIAILLYFKIKRKNLKLQEKVNYIASTGIALGYYNNFIANIYDSLKEDKLKIEVYEDNSNVPVKVEEFDIYEVELNIIIPKDLQTESMNDAIKKICIHRKGNIISKGSEKNLGINFMYSKNKIIILDFPKSLNAIPRHGLTFFSESTKLLYSEENIFDSNQWKNYEKKQLENFKTNIRLLGRRRGEGYPQIKTKFVNVHNVPSSNANA